MHHIVRPTVVERGPTTITGVMDTVEPQIIHTYESLEVGQSFATYRFVSEDDVLAFARITGDDNPIHVDAAYAAQTRFGNRIVHGVFLLALISKVLGHDFPGHGSVAVNISCRFLRPVPVNSTVKVEVRVLEKLAKRRQVKAKTYIYNEANKMTLAGEAVFIPPIDDGNI